MYDPAVRAALLHSLLLASWGLFLVQRLGAIWEVAVASYESPWRPPNVCTRSSARDGSGKGRQGGSVSERVPGRLAVPVRSYPLGQ